MAKYKLKVSKDLNSVEVKKDDGTVYVVSFAGSPEDNVYLWNCTCPSRRTCKHIRWAASAIQACEEGIMEPEVWYEK